MHRAGVRGTRGAGVRPAAVSAAALALALGAGLGVAPRPALAQALDPAVAARFAGMALACVRKEYPNKIAHVLASDADVRPPRELTPAFYGCYDWHSAVHGHWLLARLARLFPSAPFAVQAREALETGLTPDKMAGEMAYLAGEERVAFERPYGLAWLLQLHAELRGWDDPDARRWATTLDPLAAAAADRLREWMPKLAYPIRVGEHDQTAFSFALVHDWAGVTGDEAMLALLGERLRALYLADRDCPLAYEPSGQDFLSPCLGEADLVRRLLPPERFASWLGAFLPAIPTSDDGGAWLPTAVVTDPADPKLGHLIGLNLSRAWMLEGIAAGLPEGDLRIPTLHSAAAAHREAGLAAVSDEHYEGGHWLGSFATYLVTGRGRD